MLPSKMASLFVLLLLLSLSSCASAGQTKPVESSPVKEVPSSETVQAANTEAEADATIGVLDDSQETESAKQIQKLKSQTETDEIAEVEYRRQQQEELERLHRRRTEDLALERQVSRQ